MLNVTFLLLLFLQMALHVKKKINKIKCVSKYSPISQSFKDDVDLKQDLRCDTIDREEYELKVRHPALFNQYKLKPN